MLEIVLYSNDSAFLSDLNRELSARLSGYATEAFRVSGASLLQTSLFDGIESPPDLCIVDIRDDPGENLDALDDLRRGNRTEVMVVAPGPDWAMQAYDADVLAYFRALPGVGLPAPKDLDRLAEQILRRFAQRYQPGDVQFPFRTGSGTRLLSADSIVYVEYSGHRLVIHTDRGERVTTSTMRVSFGEAAARLLEDPRFVRTHASYLVNIMHVSQFERFTLSMDTGASVPVSHAKRPEVKRQISEFLGGSRGEARP